MIEHSFCHYRGVGPQTEQRLWRDGITDWAVARECDRVLPRLGRLADQVARSAEALHRRDWAHFEKLTASAHAWRWYAALRGRAMYVDIETDGGPATPESVTVIGCYDGDEVRLFVRDINLGDFPLHIAGSDLIVTYNGACFDLPFLHATFPNLRLPPVHLDLRYPLASLGYRGGLKPIEVQAGLAREEGLQHVDGWMAVLLWRRHLAGDRRALPALCRYCAEDIVGLEPLAELAYNGLVEKLDAPAPALAPTPRRTLDELPYDARILR